MNIMLYMIAFLLLFNFSQDCQASGPYKFVVKEAYYKILCSRKKILTVNGTFPGPTIYAYKGETVTVEVINQGKDNITIHWHGVRQLRNPWSDGPEYITQCPIQPGKKFSQTIILSDEEGTLWWHAHSDWSRATVHGAIIILPALGANYPFPKPYAQVPIILGEWRKKDVMAVMKEFLASGGQPSAADAFTTNGQPGDFYPCSKQDTFKLNVVHGKSYLFRIINVILNEILFFAIANHKLTVIGTDASYTKPLVKDFVVIAPGQTLDCLFYADQEPAQYYMAARAYVNGNDVIFHNGTTTGIIKYDKISHMPLIPYLPWFNDTSSAMNFSGSLRSLASKDHPIDVPLKVDERLEVTVSINTFPCINTSCSGPNGTRLAASLNNITFVNPSTDILHAYHDHIAGVFGNNFPRYPPFAFNFTADFMPLELEISRRATEVKVIGYNSNVEIVLQGTNLVNGMDHPMHLHGYSFYVVGWGFGNFNESKDPLNYNLVDPPQRNTIDVPKKGWNTLRFKAKNPGVWLMHCHIERHLSWGMNTVLIVTDGKNPGEQMLPPQPNMPPC